MSRGVSTSAFQGKREGAGAGGRPGSCCAALSCAPAARRSPSPSWSPSWAAQCCLSPRHPLYCLHATRGTRHEVLVLQVEASSWLLGARMHMLLFAKGCPLAHPLLLVLAQRARPRSPTHHAPPSPACDQAAVSHAGSFLAAAWWAMPHCLMQYHIRQPRGKASRLKSCAALYRQHNKGKPWIP